MSEIFLQIVNMSISAGWIVLAVLALRFVLKKAPKWLTVMLWGIVAVRLVCPFSVESVLSLIPSAETISPEIMLDTEPHINSGIPILNSAINPIITESFAPKPEASANPLQILIPILAAVWVLGIGSLLLYTAVSYLRIRRKVGTAVLLRENIYQCETVVSPFVLGVLKPKIYMPFAMDGQNADYVIAHERAHIRRKDHFWKPLGFLLLSLHWFNPLMWLGYVLLCKDIELACDERVIKEFDTEQRADYSQALLTCSVNRRMIAACPLAFGEVGVKERVKSVLNYKKPAFWLTLAAALALVLTAGCMLTDPDTTDPTVPGNLEFNPSIPDAKYIFGGDPVELARLQAEYPEYFGLDTSKGLGVYVWQMAKDAYYYALLPTRDTYYSWSEIWTLPSLSLAEMQTIVASYFPAVTKEEIAVVPITMLHSSYAYKIDGEYTRRVTEAFWTNFPIKDIQALLYDQIVFDVDNDGKAEHCSLSFGPTSGLFTFWFTIAENGNVEYADLFNTRWYDLSFEVIDGRLLVKGLTNALNAAPETHLFAISFQDGHIVLTRQGETNETLKHSVVILDGILHQ